MVVTPPAAALRVDQMKSSWPFWLRLCTWASIAPGSTRMPGPPCRSPAGGLPVRHMPDNTVRRQHIAVLDDPIRENDRPRKDLIRHEFPAVITKRAGQG